MINHKLEKLLRTAQDSPQGSIMDLTNFESSTSKRQFFTLYEVQVLAAELVDTMWNHFVYCTDPAEEKEKRIVKTFHEFSDFETQDTVNRFACLLQMLEDLEECQTTAPDETEDWGPHTTALVKLDHDIKKLGVQANQQRLERMKERYRVHSNIYFKLLAKQQASSTDNDN